MPRRVSVYDAVMIPADWIGLRSLRMALVGAAAGDVLEIGVGTGLNLSHYRNAGHVTLVDRDLTALGHAHRRADSSTIPMVAAAGDAERLPFPSESFDTVVVGLLLCTVPNPAAALDEVRRVVKPNGVLRFLEHVAVTTRRGARVQARLTPAWYRISGGCHLDRDTLSAIEIAGFHIGDVAESAGGWFVRGSAIPTAPAGNP